jgi:NADPH:quinone reductase-like Zn-dependent oxidoreductase
LTYGERILFPATRVVRHPENLSAAQASGAYMALLTGCFPMFEMARLQRGQALLDGVGGALLERLGKVVLTV